MILIYAGTMPVIAGEIQALLSGVGSTNINFGNRKSRDEIRALSGNNEKMFQLSDTGFEGKLAVYDSYETGSDNGTTILVTSDAKRYRITTLYDLTNSPIV